MSDIEDLLDAIDEDKMRYNHRIPACRKELTNLKALEARLAEALERNANLVAEVAGLKEKSDEFDAVFRRVMEERCPTDEVHCTCVPILRIEIERLKERNKHEQEAAGKSIGEFAHQNLLFHNSNLAIRTEIERLKAEREWQKIESAPIGEKLIAKYGEDIGDVFFFDEKQKERYVEQFMLCKWIPQPPEDVK